MRHPFAAHGQALIGLRDLPRSTRTVRRALGGGRSGGNGRGCWLSIRGVAQPRRHPAAAAGSRATRSPRQRPHCCAQLVAAGFLSRCQHTITRRAQVETSTNSSARTGTAHFGGGGRRRRALVGGKIDQRGPRRRGKACDPADIGRRPRDRHHADRFCRRQARADADRRRRNGGPGARRAVRRSFDLRTPGDGVLAARTEARRNELRAAVRALPAASELLAIPRQRLDAAAAALPAY